MKISKLIAKLQTMKDKHGDLDVYYASDYDYVVRLTKLEVATAEQCRWDGAPEKKTLYLE